MTTTIFTEANKILMQVRTRLSESTQTPLPPSETGDRSVLGTPPGPQAAGSGKPTPVQDLGTNNEPNIKSTFDLYVGSIIAACVEIHKCSEKEAENLVFSTIHDMEQAGLLPHWPGDKNANDEYMAAFLGAAKTSGLHYVVMQQADKKWGRESTTAVPPKK